MACFHQPGQTEGSFHQQWGMHPLRGTVGAGGCNRWSYRGRGWEGTARNPAASLRQYWLQLNHSWQMFTYLFFRRNKEGGSRQSISVLNCENVAVKESRNSFSFCYIRDIVHWGFLKSVSKHVSSQTIYCLTKHKHLTYIYHFSYLWFFQHLWSNLILGSRERNRTGWQKDSKLVE